MYNNTDNNDNNDTTTTTNNNNNNNNDDNNGLIIMIMIILIILIMKTMIMIIIMITIITTIIQQINKTSNNKEAPLVAWRRGRAQDPSVMLFAILVDLGIQACCYIVTILLDLGIREVGFREQTREQLRAPGGSRVPSDSVRMLRARSGERVQTISILRQTVGGAQP